MLRPAVLMVPYAGPVDALRAQVEDGEDGGVAPVAVATRSLSRRAASQVIHELRADDHVARWQSKAAGDKLVG
jgi:hypothetical protein